MAVERDHIAEKKGPYGRAKGSYLSEKFIWQCERDHMAVEKKGVNTEGDKYVTSQCKCTHRTSQSREITFENY